MKKIILLSTLIICCLQFCILSIHAQTIYGTTFSGGDEGGGTINKFMPATNNLLVVKSFESLAANPLNTNFIQASDGKLYGMTSIGGSSGYGVIFSYDPSSSTYTPLKYFDGTKGDTPYGSLVQASDGKLYGMTYNGGISGNYGVIFSFDPPTSTYTPLKYFDGAKGGKPYGSLIQARDGKLYGMTSRGGSSDYGVIFSFDPSASKYTPLKYFDGANGHSPRGSLIQASDGKLYGMTYGGGSSGSGVIFSFDPSASTYMKLNDFDGTNGSAPLGSLIQSSDGELYGMTQVGGSNNAGVIFSFVPSSSTYTKLKDFGSSSGANPLGSLMQASDGKLYGMTNRGGGSSGYGVIFSYDPSSSSYAKLKDFDNINGGYSSGSLLQANDEKLYGMTTYGGSNNAGVIFSFDLSAPTYSKLKDFNTNDSGSNVSASLMQAKNGKLYGMTYAGGSSGYGVIFHFDPSSSTYTKLKDFANTDGANPYGSLIQASDGKLYGMTANGGSSNAGVIFSFDPSTSTYIKLKDFDFNNGANPYGSLMQASDGKLYGMTSEGGSSGGSVIFSFDPSSFAYSTLYRFSSYVHPYGSLMQASNGKLYGMAWGGEGEYNGDFFSFDPSSSTYTKLKDFDGIDGGYPFGSLIQASDGKLYGVAGVIFSFDPSSSTYIKLKDFDFGSHPYGSLMQASDGKLYGMTGSGGSSGVGVIFSFDPNSSTYTKLKDYTGVNGANPYIGSAFIEVNESIKVGITSFTLVNATTDHDIQSIPDGSTLDINTLPRQVNIRANTNPNKVGSVVFILDGKKVRTENGAPYALAGDSPSGDYHNWELPLGDHTLTAIPYSKYNGKGTEGTSLTIHFTVVGQRVESFTLINAETDKSIQSLIDGAIIDLNKLPTQQLNIRANTNPSKVGSVVFILDGKKGRTENGAPYALAGDSPSGDYHAWASPLGDHTLTAIPYSNYDTKGTVGVSLTIHFTVVGDQPSLITLANRLNIPTEVMNFSLYPNPANKILNITIGDVQPNGKSTVSIISPSGAMVRTIQLNSRTKFMQLNVSSLAPGTYFIKMISGDAVTNKRFVKL